MKGCFQKQAKSPFATQSQSAVKDLLKLMKMVPVQASNY